MEVCRIPAGRIGANCYIVWENGHAVLIDPSADPADVYQAIKERALALDAILLTHGHFDHMFGLDGLRDLTGAPAYIHQEDATYPQDAEKNAYAVFYRQSKVWRGCEHSFSEGSVLPYLGGIRVYHTPGHTAGSVCFLVGNTKKRFLFTGDTLFANGYGRCDLYSGDANLMALSLARLDALDPLLPIYPGHGLPSLLGQACNTARYL